MNETHGTLEGIYITATAAALPQPVERVGAIAGTGLAGDRYALGCGTFSHKPAQRDVSLIEAEELERFVRETGHPLDAALSRRNLLTRGVRLNDLVLTCKSSHIYSLGSFVRH